MEMKLTKEKFEAVLELMFSCYGSRFLNTKQMELLWEDCRFLFESDFSQEMNLLMESTARAPNLTAMRSAVRPALIRAKRALLAFKIKKSTSGAHCAYCANSGVMLGYETGSKKNLQQGYAFLCSFCEAGSVVNYKYPRFDPEVHGDLFLSTSIRPQWNADESLSKNCTGKFSLGPEH
jgi:hypothetical protein